MNNAQFRESIDELHKRLITLTETKGAEYTRGADNRFENFERQARAMGLTREQILFVFLTKHMDSITTYVRDLAAGTMRVYAEPISGRIDDAILYLLLLRAMTIENDREMGRAMAAVIDRGAIPPADSTRWALFDREGCGGGPCPAPDPTHVISPLSHQVYVECSRLGLHPATAALTAVDQLHGLDHSHIVRVLIDPDSREHHAFWMEVVQRAEKQHFVCYRMRL